MTLHYVAVVSIPPQKFTLWM